MKSVFLALSTPQRPAWYENLCLALADRAIVYDVHTPILDFVKLTGGLMERPVPKARVRILRALEFGDVEKPISELQPERFNQQLAPAHVVSDMAVLSRSSLFVLDGNALTLGDGYTLLPLAFLFNIPILVVSDRLLQSAWSSYMATAQTSSFAVGDVARALVKKTKPRVEKSPVEQQNPGESGT